MGKLNGRTILVPESRELDLFCSMLEAQGAKALRCPLISICDVEDFAPIETWLSHLIAESFDDLILLTGEGLSRLLAHAERVGNRDRAVMAISRLRTIVRGPKPARILREIGLRPGITAPSPTSDGIIDSLRNLDLQGHNVAVQLYPGALTTIADFLAKAGAQVSTVTPYRYASAAEAELVIAAIKELSAGKIDVVAFTSTPQVQRLFEVARESCLESELRKGLAHAHIAAVGPVVASCLNEFGAVATIQPKSFHLKPLIAAISAALG